MNVYLIGHRGVGKTTVAPLVARLLMRSWVDLDAEIERREGMPVARIFAEQGEPSFRDCESAALQAVAERNDLVVATGGGVVMRPANQQILRLGVCVWLRASAETIVARLESDGYRPRLTDRSLEEETKLLLSQREPVYASLAKAVIDVDGLTSEVVAERVVRAMERQSA